MISTTLINEDITKTSAEIILVSNGTDFSQEQLDQIKVAWPGLLKELEFNSSNEQWTPGKSKVVNKNTKPVVHINLDGKERYEMLKQVLNSILRVDKEQPERLGVEKLTTLACPLDLGKGLGLNPEIVGMIIKLVFDQFFKDVPVGEQVKVQLYENRS